MKKTMELTPMYDNRKSFYGKAKVMEVGRSQVLISYDTEVAQIIDGTFEIISDRLTHTTMRHIREFMYQNGFDKDVSIGKQKIIEKYMR